MTKEISVVLENGTVDTRKVNSIEEVEEVNKTFSIHPKSIMVHYGPPYNVDLISNKGISLNILFPTLYLLNGNPINQLTKGSIKGVSIIRQLLALQFELEENGIAKNDLIKEALENVNGLNYSNHPLGYRPSGSSTEDRKGILLYSLLELGQTKLVDKYATLLENNYCPLNVTRVVATHMEELNAILNRGV